MGLRLSGDGLFRVSSLLGDASQQTHFQVADWVNALTCNDGRRTGGAIVDWRTASVFGSHHQKLMLVKGSEGLSAFCGGVDINPDRVKVVHPAMGQPLHDVHCRVRGPAARKLIDVFAQRWLSHPLHETIDREQGQLRGLSEPLGPSADKAVVRVASTFNFVKSEKINFNTFRRDACRTERSIRDMLLRAILTATRFIYFEDQYMIGPMQAKALREALRKGVQHITAVITHPSISDLPNVWAARKAFVDYVSSAPGAGDRFKVYYLVSPTSQKPGGPYTYVHAKTWIIDDEFAFIGSANVNGRGWSSDSEVGIGVIDTVASKLSPSQVSTAACSPANMDPGNGMKQSKDITEPQGHRNHHDAIQN